ncbi:MAG TPA: hypothetical protein DCM45_02075, partial [Clostridiales bacterium]|nr:hypothetical protein [Clostridiales bacterium]
MVLPVPDPTRSAKHENLVFASEALKITVDPFERLLDYDLRVPLLVFRNDNQDGCYQGTVYVPKSLSSHQFTQNDVDLSKLLMRRPNYFEFLFLLDGDYEEKINDRLNLYTPGTCRIAYQNTRHLENFNKNYSAIYFCVSPRMISEIRSAERLSSGDDRVSQLNPILSSFLGINTAALQTGIADYLLFQPKGQAKDLITKIRGIADEIKAVSDAPFYGSSLMINGLFGKLLSLISDATLYSINHIQLNTSPEAILFNNLSNLLCESKGLLSRAELEDRLKY